MPLFKLNNNRYIDTDHIADIEYTPAASPVFNLGNGPMAVCVPSRLKIEFKSTSSEPITFSDGEADAVWAAFEIALDGKARD